MSLQSRCHYSERLTKRIKISPNFYSCSPCSFLTSSSFYCSSSHSSSCCTPHGSSSEIQAPSLSSCHLLIRMIPNVQKKISVRYKKIGWFILSFGGIWIFAIYNFYQSIDCNVTPLHMLLILGEMKLLIFSLRLNSTWNQLHFLYWRLPLLTC